MSHRKFLLLLFLAAGLSVTCLDAQIYDRHPIDGLANSPLFGSRLASGNFDNDDYRDLLVGELPGSRMARFFLFPGSATFPSGINTAADASLVIAAPGLTANEDFFGQGVAVGDVNGDGFDDVIISGSDDFPEGGTADTEADRRLGAAYVFFGGSPPDADPDVLILGKPVGLGAPQSSIFGLGFDVVSGDVVGTGGVDDIVMLAKRNGASEIYIFPGSTLLGSAGLKVLEAGRDEVATILIGELVWDLEVEAGNINGDSHDDILISDHDDSIIINDTVVGAINSAWVYYGKADLSTVLYGGNADLIFKFSDLPAAGSLLTLLSSEVGDLNDDGYEDVVFATSLIPAESGFVRHNIYVHSGNTLSSLPGGSTASVETTFPIIDRFGQDLSIGELNDAPEDLLVGAGKIRSDGTAFSYNGATDFITRPIGFVPPPDVTLLSETPEESFGRTVEITGNMNNLAPGEFAVGAPTSNRGGEDTGTVYLFQKGEVDLPTIDRPACLTYFEESPIGWRFCGSVFIEAFILDFEFSGLFTRDLCDPDVFVEVTSAFNVVEINPNPDGDPLDPSDQPNPNNAQETRLLLTLKDNQKTFDELHLVLNPTNSNQTDGFVEINYLTNEGEFVNVGPRHLDLGTIGILGDLNGNGVLDFEDLKLLKSGLWSCQGDNRFLPEADLNQDGCVNWADAKIWLKLFYASNN